MSGTGGNSKHNLSSKRKKRKKYKYYDSGKKNESHSGMSRENSLLSEKTLPKHHPHPASSLGSEHSSEKEFELKNGQDAPFFKKNKAIILASSSCSKKDHREEAASSNLFIEERTCRPGQSTGNFKGSSKESNINKGKLFKNSESFVERTPSKEKTIMQHKPRHIKESKMENKFHKSKGTCPERVNSHHSPTSNLGSNCARNQTQQSNTSVTLCGERSANRSTRVRKIPGFYYDKEKKRYFKILPGHVAAASSWITSETIKEKETEEKRRILLKQENPPKVVNGTSLSTVNILRSMQEGVWNHTQYTRYSTECRVQAMNVTPASVYEPSTHLQISGITPVIQFVELDRSMSKVMVVLSSEQVSRIILGSISEEHGMKKELLLQEWQDVYIRNSTSSQISSAKLINIDQQDATFPGSLYVLFSWSGDYSNSVQLVKCPSDQDPVSYMGYRFESPGEVISSCSWSSNPRFPAHLCIGFSKEAEIIEILSSSKQRLDTEKKEVTSQVFSKQEPVIYLGLKQGYILSYDLRAPLQPEYSMIHRSPVKKKMTVLQGGCVCSLSLLNDENYLLASSSNGTIKIWDLRQRAVVKEMYGHCNEYKSLPVNIDSSESFVYSVGQDHHTRLWSMQDSSHLKTIPSPVPRTTKTSAVFSVNWGGSGLPGIMIGSTDKLYWYPF